MVVKKYTTKYIMHILFVVLTVNLFSNHNLGELGLLKGAKTSLCSTLKTEEIRGVNPTIFKKNQDQGV